MKTARAWLITAPAVFFLSCANTGGLGSMKPDERQVAYADSLLVRTQRTLRVPAELKKDALATTLSFRVDGQGQVRDFFVEVPSGDIRFDTLVRETIEKSAPLPPPPKDLYLGEGSLRVRMTMHSR